MSEMNNEEYTSQSANFETTEASRPSAPPADENNGFEQIEHNEIESAVDSVLADARKVNEEEVNNILNSITRVTPATESTELTKSAKTCDAGVCAICPYSLLGGSFLSKIELPPKVKDLVLWKCPKLSGAVFGTILVLLISLATFSLLTVISTLLLLAMSTCGMYRFYLSVVFRIKGTYDETFDKLSAFDMSLPSDKMQQLAKQLDSQLSTLLNKVKTIVLWDNMYQSAVAFTAFYMIYCVGSVFNTLTLLSLVHVGMFTLPKVYQVYKVQIDQGFDKAAQFGHELARQVQSKIPPSVSQFLHKRKTE